MNDPSTVVSSLNEINYISSCCYEYNLEIGLEFVCKVFKLQVINRAAQI